MGMNYYLHRGECQTCGHSTEKLHIGKSSWGWCFSLHVMPESGIATLDDWRREFELGGTIRNEEGEPLLTAEMLARITKRGHDHIPDSAPYGYDSWGQFHEQNSSSFGPHGLLRHNVDNWNCLGHGDGTYDFIRGNFS